MKQKNLTGLRAGIYRETQSTRGQTLLELLSALLIFLALAAIFHTISGFSAMLWLLGAGVLTCIAAAIIRHFQKTRLLLPILLAALLLVVLFARNTLLNSFGAAWNTLRDLWAAEKGILLPLAETDSTGLWLAGIVTGILLALLAVVVWQINTPVLVLVIAFLAAVAANEIMRCAKVENTFIRVVATGYAACVPFFASAKALTPWVSEAVWGKVIGAVPGVVYLIALVLVLLLAMLKGYAYTTFEDVAVSVFAGALVPFGFSVFIRLRDMFQIEQFGIYLIFYGCLLYTSPSPRD